MKKLRCGDDAGEKPFYAFFSQISSGGKREAYISSIGKKVYHFLGHPVFKIIPVSLLKSFYFFNVPQSSDLIFQGLLFFLPIASSFALDIAISPGIFLLFIQPCFFWSPTRPSLLAHETCITHV